MARRELLDISRSRTLRSRRASEASSETDLVGLSIVSGVAADTAGIGIDVSMLCGGLASRGTVADLTSCVRGDETGGTSSAVADLRRDWCELPESIDERLGDLRCDENALVTLVLR